MKIVFIGAGNLATHLSLAFCCAGHEVVQVYSRTLASATALAGRVGASATNDTDRVCRDADVYIFAVKDDVVRPLAERLCPGRDGALFLHTAGSVPLAVFDGLAMRYGVIYPMQSFSKNRSLCLRDVPIYVEANCDEALSLVITLAGSVSTKVKVLSSEARRHLHLAAVFASNFVNCCYDLASDEAAAAGVPFTDFLPLIDETAAKMHELSPHDAQTGPAVRYDKTVIDRQKQLLEGNQMAHLVYGVLSEIIHCRHEEGREKHQGESHTKTN